MKDQRQYFDYPSLLSWVKYNASFLLPDSMSMDSLVKKTIVTKFSHGQSNPTFLVEVPSGTPFVIRKKPQGTLLPSAHAIEREYEVIRHLGPTKVPVPKVYGFCSDSSVIGTPFYLMEYVKGRIFTDLSLPTIPREERRQIYQEMAKVLAEIHNVDYKKVGLESFGIPGNYVMRQIRRWTKQYEASCEGVGRDPCMDNLVKWLPANIPYSAVAPREESTIVHGDYRLDNLVFAENSSKVLAVLDWELSTIGNPFADLAYNCMMYRLSPTRSSFALSLEALASNRELGIPNEKEYLSMYQSFRDRGTIDDWNYYLVFSLFRIAAILHGVYKRALIGNASSDRAKESGDIAKNISRIAWNLVVERSNLSNESILSLTSMKRDIGDYELMVRKFMDDFVYPLEKSFFEHEQSDQRWMVWPELETLKKKARELSLWNLWIPKDLGGVLTNEEYAKLAEIMGSCVFASEIFNCSAPDTGNMELLLRFGTQEQKAVWLEPLLKGEIRSCFAMTEPLVASSDATNIASTIHEKEGSYIINGHKWWISGATDPRCKLILFLGKTSQNDENVPRHKRHSIVLIPMDSAGVKVIRPMHIFGFDDAPHGHAEMKFENVVIPKKNILLGEGRGFEAAQSRLGAGRIHHCMRAIGMAERALQLLIKRAQERKTFGQPLSNHGVVQEVVTNCRVEVDQARLLTHFTARVIDSDGGASRRARKYISMTKYVVPQMACRVIDRAIQIHGALGLCQDSVLSHLYASARTLRLADGPDEVHAANVAKFEIQSSKM
ncbi:hypothetical protein GpartN1_g1226.t1 [Galdieria partita]|uniref:Acyl-CoA dehydrogenase family member 11 n=1 Tax=Galdieria partita TaxID=83374 RepID=A0A9C7PS03_9RHOD|nr:hypothetical protein GpartN1_g1226.t1 [Galdieria partita]